MVALHTQLLEESTGDLLKSCLQEMNPVADTNTCATTLGAVALAGTVTAFTTTSAPVWGSVLIAGVAAMGAVGVGRSIVLNHREYRELGRRVWDKIRPFEPKELEPAKDKVGRTTTEILENMLPNSPK